MFFVAIKVTPVIGSYSPSPSDVRAREGTSALALREHPPTTPNPSNTSAAAAKATAAGTPEQWANEAHGVAVEKVYAAVAEGGDPPRLGRVVCGEVDACGYGADQAGRRAARDKRLTPR
jgi:hypothetical protein